MASITIRNLEDDVKHRLRVRSAEHGCSMEEEAREILRHAMSVPVPTRNLDAAISQFECQIAVSVRAHAAAEEALRPAFPS